MEQPLLKQLLATRESRIKDLIQLNLRAIEQALVINPILVSVSIDKKEKCDTTTLSLIINELIAGGLDASLQVGYLSTTLEVKLPDFETPRNPDELPFLKQILNFRENWINSIVQKLMEKLVLKIYDKPYSEIIFLSVFEDTQSVDPTICKILCQKLITGGLDATVNQGLYQTITVTLPVFKSLNDKPLDEKPLDDKDVDDKSVISETPSLEVDILQRFNIFDESRGLYRDPVNNVIVHQDGHFVVVIGVLSSDNSIRPLTNDEKIVAKKLGFVLNDESEMPEIMPPSNVSYNSGLAAIFANATNMMEKLGYKPPEGIKVPSESEISSVINGVFTNDTTQKVLQDMFSQLESCQDFSSAVNSVVKNVTDPVAMQTIKETLCPSESSEGTKTSESEISSVINGVFTNDTTQKTIQDMFSQLESCQDFSSAVNSVVTNVTDPVAMQTIKETLCPSESSEGTKTSE